MHYSSSSTMQHLPFLSSIVPPLSPTIIVQPPFVTSAIVEPLSTLLWSFGFHNSCWFVPRSHRTSLRCTTILRLNNALFSPNKASPLSISLSLHRCSCFGKPLSHSATFCLRVVVSWNSKNYVIPFFYFGFYIIIFAIWVVILHFVGIFLVSISFSYFWLFLVFLWLCSLSSIVALWWDCVAFRNVSTVASSHCHSLCFSRS